MNPGIIDDRSTVIESVHLRVTKGPAIVDVKKGPEDRWYISASYVTAETDHHGCMIHGQQAALEVAVTLAAKLAAMGTRFSDLRQEEQDLRDMLHQTEVSGSPLPVA